MALAVVDEMPGNAGFEVVSSTSPQAFNFTTTAGTDLLVVGAGRGAGSTRTITFGALTHNGDALTSAVQQAVNGSLGGKLGLWYRVAPDIGSNLSISIPWTHDANDSGDTIWAAAISFSGADQTTPIVQFDSAAASTGDPSVDLAGVVAGNITVALFGTGSGMTTSNQTLSAAMNIDENSSMNNGRMTRAASSGTVTHTADQSSASEWFAAAMVEIAAAGAAAGPSQRFRWLP